MARSQQGRPRPGRFSLILSIFSLLFMLPALAIQVTPNSPCAKLCIDDAALDVSDPASSTTVNADITCADADFNTTTAGTKWQSCLTCLQSSTFSQGAESDQAWFFYNVRYQVDLCIFGYPNASDLVGSNPCQTSTACLPLQGALFTGIPNANGSEYDYCSADNGAMTGSSLKNCLNCISGSSDNNVVANSLIALEAGCIEQRPSNESVGLSGSIFAAGTIVSVATSTSTSTSSSGKSSHIATTTIVVVAVVAVLIVAAIVGFGFVCYRKRRNSRGRAAAQRHPLELKVDALTSMESGVSGPGPKGPGGPTNGPAPGGRKASIGPVDWHSRFPSSEHISGPLHFHSPSSAVSNVTAEEMFNRSATKAVNETLNAPAAVYGASISRPSSCNSAHSSVVSSLHHEPGVSTSPAVGASPSANRKYKQQPQTDNNTTVSPSSLPSIVESPFPSPAVVGHNVGSMNVRIHSSDFDKDYAMASMPVSRTLGNMTNVANKPKQSRTRSSRSQPRLHQLQTDFDGAPVSNVNLNTINTASTVSTVHATPSSATGLLSNAAGPGTASNAYSYNPALYANGPQYHNSPRNEPHSAVSAVSAQSAASPASATAGGSVEHQLRVAMRSLPAQSADYQQQQYELQQAEYAQKLAAANVAHNARKQSGYKGWSSLVQAHQQDAYSQNNYGSPASATSASSRPGSVKGIGAQTMATRQAYADSSPVKSNAGDVSAVSRAGSDSLGLGIDNGLPGSVQGQVRKSKSGPFYSFGRGGTGSEGNSPVETRNIKTQFAPPPQHGRR